MGQQLAEKRDLDFVMWEQFDNERFLKLEKFKDYNKKTCNLILDEARKIAINEVLPTMRPGEEEGLTYENDEVKTPACFRPVFELLKEGEWGNLGLEAEMGGQGAPMFITSAVGEYLLSANWPLNAHWVVTKGAAELVHLFGTEEQKETYLEKMVSLEWGGTMLLTEPDAGSDLGAIETSAVKNPDGTYSLTGNKIFITNGEHDLCENIIHPVLARVEGAPAGTRGISLFIVPKFLVNKDGSLGKRNDIRCTGIEHKHGIKASPTCSMTLGSKNDCTGFLLGEENQGMRIMFNMMNGARMDTGLQALGYASAAYLLALDYARERIQMRVIGESHNAEPVAIVNHPDVRRNLMWMKSYVNGMRSFFQYMYYLHELSASSESEEERQVSKGLFELLTPVLKSYLSNRAHEICVQAMQVFGGAGYTQDYLIEQYLRDCKITSIYEGTCGIQAMDLLGRKMAMMKGKVFLSLLDNMRKTVATAMRLEGLSDAAVKTGKIIEKLEEVGVHLSQKTRNGEVKTAFAHSLPFLNAVGDTIVAWMLLWRAATAQEKLEKDPKKGDAVFYKGQLKTAEFFLDTMMNTCIGKMDDIMQLSPAAVDITDEELGGL